MTAKEALKEMREHGTKGIRWYKEEWAEAIEAELATYDKRYDAMISDLRQKDARIEELEAALLRRAIPEGWGGK